MEFITTIFQHPAFWGFGGAFIYAAPKLIACLAVKVETNGRTQVTICVLEFIISLIIGSFVAGAFSKTAAGFVNLPDPNALAAILGLLANPTAPKLVDVLSGVAANSIGGRVADVLKRDPK